jgi:UDP-N-acetylmuramate--alanine ligase
MATLFFCGIGGSGMSALAIIMARRGHTIIGSDRSFDQGKNNTIRTFLEEAGVRIAPQDGSGLSGDVDEMVISSAVEDTIPDVRAAKEHGVSIIHRSQLLLRVFEEGPSVAIGGTSGKTTVTAMTGHVLRTVGRDPTVVNGGIMLNSTPTDGIGNAWCGKPECCVIEADESDGTIERYSPEVAVLTTVSLDHLPMSELKRLFRGFLNRAQVGAVVNGDSQNVLELATECGSCITFGISNPDADLRAIALKPTASGVDCSIVHGTDRYPLSLPVPGQHNVMNALAAIGACVLLDVPIEQSVAALASFKGTRRRLELVGVNDNQVTVIDDFAHNPEKIDASLATLTQHPGRVIVYYQPHGFKPTKMLKDELIESFATGLREGDMLIMPEIFFAGGTVSRDISSKDLTEGIGNRGKTAHFVDDREIGFELIKQLAKPNDRIVVMGARDNTLSEFARDLLEACK